MVMFPAATRAWPARQRLTDRDEDTSLHAPNTHAPVISRMNTYTNTSFAIQRANLHAEEQESNRHIQDPSTSMQCLGQLGSNTKASYSLCPV